MEFLPYQTREQPLHYLWLYSLTAKDPELGYHPEVILAGRAINDNIGVDLAQRLT